MTKQEKAQRIQASIKANKLRFASQAIKIDENWSIIRLDELNWQIKPRQPKKHKEPWHKYYYGTLYAAFMDLPHKMLQAEAKSSLADVYRSHRGLVEKIERVLPASRILL